MTFATLDRSEVVMVARAVHFAERTGLDAVARTISRLGNGPLYPLLAGFVVLTRIAPPRFVLTSTLSVLIAVTVYTRLKRTLRRSRPCDYDRSLVCSLLPLDSYSCPSGHTMMAVAFGLPLALAAPFAAPVVAAGCAVMAWSRVAVGHHYISDVLIGAVLGALIALPVAWVVS